MSAIEKLTITMTEAQEKNHTDHIDLSSRTPRGQLMWGAVTYTQQAGAGGTNAPLPSRKKFSFLGSPMYGGQSHVGTGFLLGTSVYPCQMSVH